MNPREKKILALTIVALAAFVFVRMRGEGGLSFGGFGGGEIELARAGFQDSLEILKKGPAIRQAYDRLNTQLPESIPGRTPELTFSDEVTRMLTDRNWQTPKVKPPGTAEIEDVSDYYYIDLELSVPGTLDKVLALLVDFQEKNILIKEFKIEKPRADSDQVVLDVTVSRLARAEGESERKSIRR